ncbi:MAG: SAM-dependent methyltransferase [Cystobacterineae bacterium]|nr:SAM-dependent methyltransferase [Cystobacterineae bacterium]
MEAELLEGQSKALLQALHLLTPTGALNADARRKLKQVNHLIRLLEPAIEDIYARHEEPCLVDVGSGKGYLGFILHELVLAKRGRGQLYCVESNAELLARAEGMAQALGFSRLRFIAAPIATAILPERVHLVTGLHACDTATDDALARALLLGVEHVALVPCCQAELARALAQCKPAVEALHALFSHPLHRREFGSHLSNVVRCLAAQAMGYQVSVTELVGWEHSAKNELLLCRRVQARNAKAQKQLSALLELLPVRMHLLEALSFAHAGGG